MDIRGSKGQCRNAIYGGATIDVCSNGETLHLDTLPKGYRRQLSHDGMYAAATLMANDDAQSLDQLKEDTAEDDSLEESKPRKCYIFCQPGIRTGFLKKWIGKQRLR